MCKVFFLVFLLLMLQYSYHVSVSFCTFSAVGSAVPSKCGFPTLIKLLVVPRPLLINFQNKTPENNVNAM